MRPTTLALLLSTTLGTLSLAQADDFSTALSGGKMSSDLRVRYENVDQDNALKEATAQTARWRLGYTTADFNGFFVSADVEHIQAMGDEDYDSKTNGHGTYSTIADPTETELNQAFVGYKGVANTVIKYGRQRLVLDNQRFIGNVGWRQNEQTFDAFSVVNTSVKNLTVTAAQLSNVNRIFGDEADANAAAPVKGNWRVKAPILNVNYKFEGIGDLSGYVYNLDVIDFANSSTSTKGLRWKGNVKISEQNGLGYVVEWATQSDYADNAFNFDHDYQNLEVSFNHGTYAMKLGRETLEGDGSHAFQTPLATLHAFNGWADMFLITPVTGLVDTSVSFNAKWDELALAVVLNDFDADIGGLAYGKEKGVMLTKAFGKTYTVGLKVARYTADDIYVASNVDTNKLWLWGEMKF